MRIGNAVIVCICKKKKQEKSFDKEFTAKPP